MNRQPNVMKYELMGYTLISTFCHRKRGEGGRGREGRRGEEVGRQGEGEREGDGDRDR